MSKSLKTLILWLILIIAICYLQTGCFSSSKLRLPFSKTNSPSVNTADSSSNPYQREILDNRLSSGFEDSTGGDTSNEELDNLSLTTFRVDSALFWAAQAEIDLSRGDTLAAEASLVIGISLLGGTLVDLSPAERLVWMDSLATWAMRYSSLMGGEYEPLDPGAQGMAAFPVEAFLDTAVVDSLMLEIAIDSFAVEIDTTIDLMRPLPEIPDTMNSKVQSVIDYFTGTERGRKAIETWFSRAGEIIPRMTPILRQNGVPEDLVYLAMIESGFRSDARSWARAVGPWQFIHSTAKLFNLEANWWYDERRDSEKSTIAAARYLRQLYEHLGDWYLAIAGYNCGEGRIWRERRRHKTADFWKLKRLPKQTRHYIPTFLAARRIAQNPEEYGFAPIQYVEAGARDSVIVRECVDLTTLSEIVDVTVDTLQKMNPALIRWCTPPAMDSVIIYVPQGVAEGFEEKFAAIPEEKKTSWVRHKVKIGETLGLIAKKYKTTVQAILDVPANKIKNPHRISEGAYLLIPVVPQGVKANFSHLARFDDAELPDGAEKQIYSIRRNDTLSQIAERHGVGLSKLLRWNNLHSGSTIYPGQKLVLYPPAENPGSGSENSEPKRESVKETTYIVQSGDTPWDIAKKHDVLLSDLLAVNGLSRHSTIHTGERLVIPGKTAPADGIADIPEFHIVQHGDSLSKIAKLYQIELQDLVEWNSIKDIDRLNPGDKIRLKPLKES